MVGETRTTIERVVQTVAESTHTDPMDLPPLYEAIDTDALNSILEDRTDVSVSFKYAGTRVTATSDGYITIEESPGAEIGTPAMD